jgi:hypothetical protein
MARFNEILTGRFNRFLQKLLVLKGGPPSPQLASEIMPSFLLNDFLSDVWFQQNIEMFAKNAVTSGVAAVNSALRWRNPKGSNVVALVLLVCAHSSVAAEIFSLEYQPTGSADLGTIIPTTIQNLDNRGRPSSTLIVSSATSVAALQFGVQQRAAFNATQSVDFLITDIQVFPLLPDSSFQVRTNNVNASLSVSAMWRERLLEESERT